MVPGNCPALLGMLDMAALNIINLNIDSIQVEITKGKTNKGQETDAVVKGCTNRDTGVIIKQEANSLNGQHHSNKLVNYFYLSKDVEADKQKSSTMTQKIHDTFGDVFNGIGCFEGTFHYSLGQTGNHTKHHQGMQHMHYRNHSKRNSSACKQWTS